MSIFGKKDSKAPSVGDQHRRNTLAIMAATLYSASSYSEMEDAVTDALLLLTLVDERLNPSDDE